MIIGRISFFKEDMTCVIGLKPFSSLTLLIYDLCMNVFLNAMFLWPLLRSKLINPRLRKVARRTLAAAGAALATSVINIATLTAMKQQLGWVCLGSCGTDVTLNAIVIFWVTMPMTDSPSHSGRQAQQSSSYNKPNSDLPQSPATANSPIVFSPPSTYAPRASFALAPVNKPSDVLHQPSPLAHDLRHASALRGLPECPSTPAVPAPSSEDISMNSPTIAEDLNKRATSPGPIHSLRKLLRLSKQKERDTTDVTVHVSVVTQHEVELGDMENGRAKQDDGELESIEQNKRQSEWFR
ncbi:hypothetical protein RSOLAG1IB_00262 [Rhizoctonia solani AG-1 IB]|uniref:Transmembrane protein n=1 Tax=Thanatephorus cucumeris (strain AG1-IB / isolate 7/3/14) TaxID=1108050 RepID=A0A0B7F680_THACB|nr:hypothetical protein RSOLAG1IB_00262 [Rhizoctonia solani AG-1 IB]